MYKISSRLIKFILSLLLIIVALNFIFPLDKNLYEIKYSKIYYSDDKTPMRMTLSDDEFWRFYASSEEIPALLKNSILTFEDKHFYSHFGFNPISILRAVVNNVTNKSRIGASTISMQVIRMVEPNERTYFNKIIEIFKAVQLEMLFSKNEILNIYFNKAPYGGNIEGLRAAAYFYFGKSLNELSISEIGILTTIPKNPNSNRPDKQKNLSKKRDLVLLKLLDNKLINKSQYNRAKQEAIVSIKQKPFFDAVQYTNSLKSDSKTEINTTIDYQMQKYIQAYLKNEVKKYEQYNLHNAAAVVIDNKTLEIKAYIGSNDFFDKKHGGQNDGVLMKKSPGSTLKPFVYALAMDKGLITPKRNLLDIPMNFNGYIPKNYNGKFIGEVTAEEALKLSLNIPAIDLQNQLGDDSLYELMEKVGVGVNKLKSTYGLSIVVGGIDLSLLELTKLYTIFSNEGSYKYSDQKLISKESSYLVSDILSQGYREKFDAYWESSINSKRVAFKTGTSSDAKHLYTVGYTPNYTIGLWFGNFDGRKTTGNLTGMNTVSDSLIQLFENIEKSNAWFIKPDTIAENEVCADYYSNDDCEVKTKDLVIKNVGNQCMQLDTQKIKFYNKNKKITTKTIASNKCYKEFENSKPSILVPNNEDIFVFNKSIPKELRIIKIECQPYDDNDELQVYLNGQFVENNSFKQLDEGNYNLVCMKSFDKYDEVNFRVSLR